LLSRTLVVAVCTALLGTLVVALVCCYRNKNRWVVWQ